MDKLTQQLKADAERIDVQVSDDLDRRIEASLLAVAPDRPQPATAKRNAGFWWASSLTGIAAALVIIAIVNFQPAPEVMPQANSGTPPVSIIAKTPVIDLKMRSAMLTSPLQQELEDLQSDIKKAELQVREDIGL